MGRDRGVGRLAATDRGDVPGGLAAGRADGDELERRFAAARRDGVAADSPAAMDLAEEHRQQITRNFHDCPPEVHAGLGPMYVEDERFTAHYERLAPGPAQYVSSAVQANAARQSR